MLKLNYKRIPDEAVISMKNAVSSNINYYDEAVHKIQTLLPSNETHILNSANSCIFTVTEVLPTPILILDQGGWNGLERSANILNKEVHKFKSDNGLVDITKLETFLKNNEINAFYMTSLAGYTAQQPIKEIYELCIKYDVIFVLDISGSIGDDNLSKTEYADIQISSTGSPKIVNIENGGFINNITQKVKFNTHLLKTFKADNITCAGISSIILNSSDFYIQTLNANMYIKRKLFELLKEDNVHNIFHVNYYGINTIFSEESKSKAKKLSFKIRERIEVSDDKNIITTGPNYNRIKNPCICIETKNIDKSSLTKENMDELIKIIINSINE